MLDGRTPLEKNTELILGGMAYIIGELLGYGSVSFVYAAHIDRQNIRADMAGINVDSFEDHGSVYTIMGNLNGKTLGSVLESKKTILTVPIALNWTINLPDALQVFHKNNLLHLDISADNILLLPLDEAKPEKQRKIMLIDFNSVWSRQELSENADFYFGMKENYSAPELRMKEMRYISPAFDLFSVCAVFLELLQGKPMDYSVLYTGGRITNYAGLLKDA